MIIGEGEVNRYIIINFGIRVFEFRNLGVFFVVLLRVKFIGRDNFDFDFVWYFFILINEDRVCYKVSILIIFARE